MDLIVKIIIATIPIMVLVTVFFMRLKIDVEIIKDRQLASANTILELRKAKHAHANILQQHEGRISNLEEKAGGRPMHEIHNAFGTSKGDS